MNIMDQMKEMILKKKILILMNIYLNVYIIFLDDYKDSILTRSIITQRLKIYLQIFSNFQNPEKHYASKLLKSIYFHLLSKSNEELQSLSLKCYLTFKDSVLSQYTDNLNSIINEKTFKESLIVFSLNNQKLIITNEERNKLIPVLIRILYGKVYFILLLLVIL